MATAPISLFNTPQQYQQQQWQQAQEQAKAFALMDNYQKASYGAAMGGQLLGNALPSMLGVEDPELAKIKDIQGMFKGVDRNDPEALQTFAKALADKGYAAEAEQAFQRAQDVAAGAAGIAKDNAIAAKNKAEQGKIELSTQQEAKLREELSRLGPDATEEDFLNVVRKYGNPNDVMKSIETRMQKDAALEEKKRAAEAALAAKLEEARMRGDTAKEIARMQIEGRREIAAMMAETRRAIADSNKEKPLTAAQQLKLDKDKANSNKGLRDMDNTLQNTVNLANQIKTHPGFEGAQGWGTLVPSMPGGNTAKAEALIEEFRSGVKKAGLDLARQGGSIGSMTEKEWPIVESMVAAINPRAGNVKEQMDKVISKIEQIRNNAYITHNEAFSDAKAPTEVNKPSTPTVKTQDAKAIEWAKAHPNDPRSSAILKANGM